MSEHELDFNSIYDTFRPKIHRYLTRLVGEHEAEDLTQEVFVKIDRSLKRFRGESQLSTWIYRVATNAALDRLRNPSFRRTVLTGLIGQSEGGTVAGVEKGRLHRSEATSLVDQELVRKEMNDCIRDFISQLPGNYRTAIVLSELIGFKNHEIAKVLGVSVETVKIRLHRARLRLKNELETHCSFYYDERNEFACEQKGRR